MPDVTTNFRVQTSTGRSRRDLPKKTSDCNSALKEVKRGVNQSDARPVTLHITRSVLQIISVVSQTCAQPGWSSTRLIVSTFAATVSWLSDDIIRRGNNTVTTLNIKVGRCLRIYKFVLGNYYRYCIRGNADL
ncbi:hypothetical protein J6590_087874 [Homalodisca vitripennis]|nr:hypothetical protein J6590_087874 [Homalodisca vitripennis]